MAATSSTSGQVKLKRLAETDLAELQKKVSEASQKHKQQWYLGAAVANASGLVAVVGAVLDALVDPKDGQDFLLQMVMPSAWLFALGLILAGLIPLVALKAAKGLIRLHTDDCHGGDDAHTVVSAKDYNNVQSLASVEGNLCYWSAGLFGAGLTWPLLVLTAKVF